MEVILGDALPHKHSVFPVNLVKPYSSRDKNEPVHATPVPILEPNKAEKLLVHKILKEKKEGIQGKDTRLYLVRYRNQSTDKDEWLPENNIPDSTIHLRNFRASKRK